jgi:hypothetical protein
MIRVEHNVETGEILEVEFSTKEVKELEKVAADRLAYISKSESDAAAKAALLDRLGITAEEAALLLG